MMALNVRTPNIALKLINKKTNTIDTEGYRKPTNTDACLKGNSHAPATWKREALRTILNRPYSICSTGPKGNKIHRVKISHGPAET